MKLRTPYKEPNLKQYCDIKDLREVDKYGNPIN